MESGWTGRTIEDIMPAKKGDWTVYMHIFPCVADNIAGHKVYVGICKGKTKSRWGNDGSGYKTQPVYRAIQKYGWNNIVHFIVSEGCTHEAACNLEKQLIKMYKSHVKDGCGYNATSGGDGVCGIVYTAKQRKERSERTKGCKNPNYGKRWTDEQRKAASIIKKQYRASEETKIKISKSSKARWNDEKFRNKILESRREVFNSPEYRKKAHDAQIDRYEKMAPDEKSKMGDATRKRFQDDKYREKWIKSHNAACRTEAFRQAVSAAVKKRFENEEERLKISIQFKGKKQSEEHVRKRTQQHVKKVLCIESGIVYKSAKEVNELLGINRDSISMACREVRHTAGGYHWKYVDEE